MTTGHLEAGTGPAFDGGELERFVDEHVPGARGAFSVQRHVAGYSNETYFVRRGADRMVLRRPPRGPLLPTAHDVVREYRFLAALAGRARVPEPLAVCEDLSVIGAPFYLMRRVQGSVPRFAIPAAYDNPAGYAQFTAEMVDALVELHAVDWREAGIPGRENGYLERQVKRWSDQWALTRPRTRELPGLDRITAWLKANIPASPAATVVHGDYKPDNTIFENERPRLVAILDWEMATVGDPIADVAYLLNHWESPARLAGAEEHPSSIVRVTDREGFRARPRWRRCTPRRAAARLRICCFTAYWQPIRGS